MAKFIQYMTKDSLYDGPFDSKSGWPAAGMGDVIVTENGKLIVVDGGQPHDADTFIELLEAQAEGKIPEIEHWIITHPHLDHYGAIKEISKNQELKNRINVKQFIYWFPDEFCNKEGQPNALDNANREMRELCEAMNADFYMPKRDDILTLDDITLQFLYVPDDCSILNTSGGNYNFCSLIFTIKGKEKKVMITGDAYGRSMQVTAWRYAKKLKCDILQMPHHALCDAFCVDFYKHIDPQILLMPISKGAYRSMHSKLYDSLEGCIANLCVEAKAEKTYKAFEGTAELFI